MIKSLLTLFLDMLLSVLSLVIAGAMLIAVVLVVVAAFYVVWIVCGLLWHALVYGIQRLGGAR